MKILITGFGPFLENAKNTSQEILFLLKTEPVLTSLDLQTLELPVEFSLAFEVFERKRQEIKPNLVFQLGLAASRCRIGLEKVGLNWIETSFPDNSGKIPPVGEIFKNEPLGLLSQMPWSEFITQNPCKEVELSFSAGTYVCNDLYYRSLREQTKSAEYPSVGFIHLPPESPSFSIDRMKEVLVNIISWMANDSLVNSNTSSPRRQSLNAKTEVQ